MYYSLIYMIYAKLQFKKKIWCYVSPSDMFLFYLFYLYFRHVMHFSKMIQENQTDMTTVPVQRLDLNWYITYDYQSSSKSIDQDEDSNGPKTKSNKYTNSE